MRQMKDSGVSWMPLIPSSWQMVPNYAVMSDVSTPVGNMADDYTLLSLTKQGVIVRDLEAGGKFPTSCDTYKVVEPGQMVFCLFDIDETPRTVGLSHHHGMIRGAYDIYDVDYSVCDSRYLLYYYLVVDDNKHLRPHYRSLRKTVTPTAFRHIKMPLPPIEEQRSIADYLDDRCAAIEETRQTLVDEIEALQRLRKATIHKAVTKGLDDGVPMQDSGVKWIGDVPCYWTTMRLKHIAINRVAFASSECGMYLGLENVSSWTMKVIVSSDEQPNASGILYDDDCVLFGKLRPYLAKVAIPTSSGPCSSEFLVLIPRMIEKRYLAYSLIDSVFIDEVNSLTYGVKMPRAGWDLIGCMRMPYPNRIEQQRIADYLDERCAAIDSVIDTRTKQLERLDDYRKALIFAYVTGKKEVPVTHVC